MNHPGEFIRFQTEGGQTRIDIRVGGETVWLSAGQIAEPFQCDKSTISREIHCVFAEGERDAKSVVALSASTASDGKTYQVEHYALDVDTDATRALTEQRYETYRRSIDWQPSPLDPHFDEAVGTSKVLGNETKSLQISEMNPDLQETLPNQRKTVQSADPSSIGKKTEGKK